MVEPSTAVTIGDYEVAERVAEIIEIVAIVIIAAAAAVALVGALIEIIRSPEHQHKLYTAFKRHMTPRPVGRS